MRHERSECYVLLPKRNVTAASRRRAAPTAKTCGLRGMPCGTSAASAPPYCQSKTSRWTDSQLKIVCGGSDGHVRTDRSPTDLQAPALLPRTSLRPAQPRDEDRTTTPRRAGCHPTPRRPHPTRRRRSPDAEVQASEEPLAQERPRHHATQAERPDARDEEAGRG